MENKRIEKVAAALEKGEAVLISSEPNRLYLTGFHSSAGTVLVTKSKAYFLADFRYFEKATATVRGCECLLCEKLYHQLNELFKKHNIDRLYMETSTVSIETFARYLKEFTGIEISDNNKIDRLIHEMRSIKSAEEIALIRRAQSFTDQTFTHILEFLKPGLSEREVMLEMEFFIRRLGSEGVSFDFIVVSGKNTSLPHGEPGEKRIEKGDFVLVDFGGVACGYHSDMTRTVAIGKPSEEQILVYDTVLQAQQKALAMIKPGLRCCDVDKAARDLIAKAGYGDAFGHGLGHSVGLEIHENPAFNLRCETILKPGHVLTVEPGIYLENRYGVRIEDMVAVTKNGADNLTASPKELIVL